MTGEKDLVFGDNFIVQSFVPVSCKMLHNNNAGLCSQNAYVIVDTYFLDQNLISSVIGETGCSLRSNIISKI